MIELAEKYGLDTTGLLKAMDEDLEKLNKKTTASIFGISESKFAKIRSTVDTVIQGIGLVADAWSAYNDLQKTKSDIEISRFEKRAKQEKRSSGQKAKKGHYIAKTIRCRNGCH